MTPSYDRQIRLAARGESQPQARARDFSADRGSSAPLRGDGAKPQAYWSISRILQHRAGGKDPLSARSDFCHGLLGAVRALLLLIALPGDAAAQGLYDLRSVRVTGGHPVDEVSGGVIFSQSYDDGCQLVADVERPGEKPIAATVSSRISFEVNLMSCPQLQQSPRVTCSWEIPGTAVAGEESWEGYRHSLSFDVPERTGVYEIFLDCRMSGLGPATQEIVQRTLYATYKTPLGTVLPSPPAVWYEKACTWGEGFTAYDREKEVLRQVLSRIYPYAKKHWRYGSFPDAVPAGDPDQPECSGGGWCHCSWKYMVAGSACNFGSCYEMSDIFESMAATLGIGGLESYVIHGVADAGFITRPGRPAFDPRFPRSIASGNAEETGSRYLFSSHSLRARDGLYYDATFNHVYHSANEAIGLNIALKDNEVTFVGSPAKLCLAGPGYGTWTFYHHPERTDATSPQVCPENPADPVKVDGVTFSTSGELSPGIATQLVAEVGVDVEIAGRYSVHGAIYDHQDGSLITHRPFWESDRSTSQNLNANQPGKHSVRLQFSGEAIRRQGKGGPYQFRASIHDHNGIIDHLVAAVPELDPDSLGEVEARILGLSARQAEDGGLRCEVSLEVLRADTFLFHLRLAQGGDTVTYVNHSQALEPGPQSLEIDIPGSAIAGRGSRGSYRITLVAKTSEHERVGSMSAAVEGLAVAPPP